MIATHENLKELEFPQLLEEICPFAFSEKTEEKIRLLQPLSRKEAEPELKKVSEYTVSFETGNPVPFTDCPDIEAELKVMTIEDYRLSAVSFLKIRDLCFAVGKAVVYFTKFHQYYPVLSEQAAGIKLTKKIILAINTVFTKHGEIKASASPELEEIRMRMGEIRKLIQEKFNQALTKYGQQDLLDNIRETVIDDQRVLAVKSGFKKRIKGRIFGESKSGTITFIQPERVALHQNELRETLNEEKKETDRILKNLTAALAEYQPLLTQYQAYVFDLDLVQAKARFAEKIHGVLPQLSNSKRLYLRDAYHPLLWLRNHHDAKPIYPQTLELSPKTRILCISGPNAGGKSVTLKTVGLLQVMLQSGLLVPVHPRSEFFFFKQIRTDIGDNQSIENHLSTYSSRLRKMSKIIPIADDATLLLIDEFGTGSDPELGGALAEALLEYFYQKKSFAILTTHYTNIKLIAERLPHAQNAAMLFDEHTLNPLYKLEIGQAGSSFTFEVAHMNHIPEAIIHSAKEKVEHDIVNLDKTIVKLQQEKYEVEKLKSDLTDRKESVEGKRDNLQRLNEQLEKKLYNFQLLYEEEHKKMQFGKRVDDFIQAYLNGKKRKDIVHDFVKMLEQEKFRKQEVDHDTRERLKVIKRKVTKQLESKTVQEKIAETNQKIEKKKQADRALWLKIGQRVRIKGSTSIGTIEKIDKNEKVTLNYGKFTTIIPADDLERI